MEFIVNTHQIRIELHRKSIKPLSIIMHYLVHSRWSDHNSLKRLSNLSLKILFSCYSTCYTIQNTLTFNIVRCISKIRDFLTAKSFRIWDPDPDLFSTPDRDPDPDQKDPEHQRLIWWHGCTESSKSIPKILLRWFWSLLSALETVST